MNLTGFSICVNYRLLSFIFLYFYPLFLCFLLLKHPTLRSGILRSLKHAIGREMSQIYGSEYVMTLDYANRGQTIEKKNEININERIHLINEINIP